MEDKKFYLMKPEEVLEKFKSSKKGLTKAEAAKRLAENGPNKLKEAKKKTMFARFIDQFKNVMIIVLIVAAILSAIVGIKEGEGMTDCFIIMAVIMLNAILGVVQESKAEAAIEALKKMSAPFIKVRRSNKVESIKTEDLVVGDVVLLEAGDFVPADLRIIENASIKVEEAALTGESVPVEKELDKLDGEDIILAERLNMLFSGSSIVYGRGEGVVTGTGMNTELGKIASALNMEKEGLTPLQRKMEEISKVLSIIVIVVAAIMMIVGFIQKDEPIDVFMMAISLAVAAIPEGLPAVITITLAIGVQKMAKAHATVRKMSSVETLGSTQIICSDKTGTLTQNKMTVTDIVVNGKRYDVDKDSIDGIDALTKNEYVNALMLSNDSKLGEENGERVFLGDPTETALVYYSEKIGFVKEDIDSKYPRVSEVPFDSERKLMSSINKSGEEYKVYTKGAVESILLRATKILENGVIKELGQAEKNKIIELNKQMASEALRVLALSYKPVKNIPATVNSMTVENDLVYIGLVAMIDPPRPEAKDAVKKCFEAGMIPVMITGDNKETAMAIATELGIMKKEGQAIMGEDLDKLSDEEFENKVLEYRVYARVSPENKIRIVKAWQAHDKIVAMTGDGVNDAPALKGADIGVGMGITGTEVSKSVSSMVLTDDNFATIVSAVKEGRKIYKNIQNVIAYLLASNLAEVIIIFFATLFNMHILIPIQLLWINLISDSLPALALGFEGADKNIMKHKPRNSKENFFNPFLICRIAIPAIIKSVVILGVYFYEMQVSGDPALATTIAFMTLALEETLFAMVCRNDRKLIVKQGFFSNKIMVAVVLGTILLQYAVIFIAPIRQMFKLEALNLTQHLIVIASALAVMVASEIVKLILNKVFKEDKKTF
ncbi:MAG: cation-translocating P-type ATPase [Clostridia bacterium]